MRSRCQVESFPTLADAQGAIVERRARSTLAGSPRLELAAYECECGRAHIVRARGMRRAA
ncbi:MAG: hypothetical protein L0H64_11125 [Pseudonocardia sp.]|nr:hypothetical protein [Pseudonocardia sp.]